MSSALNIHYMNVSIGEMEEFRELTTKQEVPPKRELELSIEAVQVAIARLQETPYTASLLQKRERLAQYYREYVEAYSLRELIVFLRCMRKSKA